MGAHGVGDVTVQAIDDAAARRLSNLPDLLSSFIGRQAEIDEVAALVADHRLVTVTGPGGGGKTRLAHRVAIDLIPAFPDGVWWVELAGLTAPAGIGPAVARTLGIHDDLSGDIAGQLADRRMLLVLDNCEHLLSGAAEMVHRVLASCPQVQVLATSRIALAVPGEVTWRIPAMVMPRRDDVTADDAVACDAVALFVVRARGGGLRRRPPRSRRDPRRRRNLPPTRRAAAGDRAGRGDAAGRSVSPKILDALGDAVPLLTRRTHDAGSTSDARRVDRLELRPARRRSAVGVASPGRVAGGCSVGRGACRARRPSWAPVRALDVLDELVASSLLAVEHGAGRVRYGLLETVREFAGRRLGEAGERAVAQERHAASTT